MDEADEAEENLVEERQEGNSDILYKDFELARIAICGKTLYVNSHFFTGNRRLPYSVTTGTSQRETNVRCMPQLLSHFQVIMVAIFLDNC